MTEKQTIEQEALEHVKEVGGNNACYDSYIAGRSAAEKEIKRIIDMNQRLFEKKQSELQEKEKEIAEKDKRIKELEEEVRDLLWRTRYKP